MYLPVCLWVSGEVSAIFAILGPKFVLFRK